MAITFDNITMEEAVGTAMGHIAARSRCRVVTPNAEFALEAKKNPRFLKILNTSQLVLADGISVVLASKIIGDPMQGRVTGVGFAQALIGNPDVLILDEPTRNFSPLSGPVIRKMLREFPGAIISISHDRKYIDEVCDKVYELNSKGLNNQFYVHLY